MEMIEVDGIKYRACSKCRGNGKYNATWSSQFGMPCTHCFGTGSVKLGMQRRIEHERQGELREIANLKRELASCYKKIYGGSRMEPIYRKRAEEIWTNLMEKSQRITLEEIQELSKIID